MAMTTPLGAAPEEVVPEQEAAQPGAEPSAGLRARIVSESKEIEDDCRVAVRCHAAAASKWTLTYYVLGLPTAVLAALAGISAFNNQPDIAAAFAIAATISAAANTFLNAGQIANAHAKKRSEYEQLKNEIRHFRNITLEMHRPATELVRELTQYSHTRDVLNLESPQVSNRTYRREAQQRGMREMESDARSASQPARV